MAASVHSGRDLRSAAAFSRTQQIEAAQSRIRQAAIERKAVVLHATHVLLNAVYISATEEQARTMRSVPGVAAVLPLHPIKRHAANELELINAQAGWNALSGGQSNAGAGVKIAVIDTGIDQTHPAFQQAPPGGAQSPKCTGDDCQFTNSKVIAARSYVTLLQNNPDIGATGDDTSPRDRVGHGTAVAAIAAGAPNTGPTTAITGVAPAAYLGNYKVFGSPGVNDFTSPDVVVKALEDAAADGMNIALMTHGFPAVWGPGDLQAVCGGDFNPPGTNPPFNQRWCDPYAGVIDAASKIGLTVVVSAGNDGDLGAYPNLNSINSPGTAPSALTVGATTNARAFYAGLKAQGSNVPSSLNPARALFTDGPRPDHAITAPAHDVSASADGTGCSALPAGSLNGAFAVLSREGDCTDRTRISNAQNAGALGVILYRTSDGSLPFALIGLTETGVTAVIVGKDTGTALKSWLGSNPNGQVTLDPALTQCTDGTCLGDNPDVIALFSSQGPNIGDFAIKPEIVAPGTGMYVATQKYDPNGDMWSASGYTVVQGTSFSAAMVGGAAAIAKQRFPAASPDQVKSLVVNSANPSNVKDFDLNNNEIDARVTGMGAGKLDLGKVAQTTIAANPATISFGVPTTLPISKTITITNLGSNNANLTFSVQRRDSDARAQVQLSTTSAQLAAGASTTVNVQLTGSTPSPGAYEGAIVVTGGGTEIRIPYLYLVGGGVVDHFYQLRGWDWSLGPSSCKELDFKAVDQYGVPVKGVSYTWSPNTLIRSCDSGGAAAGDTTDDYGIGWGIVNTSSATPGPLTINLQVGSNTIPYAGTVYPRPTISAVTNAGNGDTGQGVAPGSYVSVWGSGLSHATQVFGTYASTPYLPLALSSTSVTFGGPNNTLIPGRLNYASDGQVNVVVPWELKGQSSTVVTVATPEAISSAFTVKLNNYSPAVFVPVNKAGQVVNKTTSVARGVGENDDYLVIYANGLGPVDHTPATGAASPLDPVAITTTMPTVTVGGKQAKFLFSGLTPNFVGLYQINVQLPDDTPTGVQPLVIDSAGVKSQPYEISVR